MVELERRMNSDLWNGLEAVNTSNLKSLLHCTKTNPLPWTFIESCTSLTSLDLAGQFSISRLLNCLTLISGIQFLSSYMYHVYQVDDLTVIELKHLQELWLMYGSPTWVFLPHLNLPKLRKLLLYRSHELDITDLATRQHPISSLANVTLISCKIPVEPMIGFLRRSRKLRKFEMNYCKFAESGDADRIIAALGHMEICPLLQCVDVLTWKGISPTLLQMLVLRYFAYQYSISGSSESMDIDTPPVSESSIPTRPIVFLSIPHYDGLNIPWFRSKIPIVICPERITGYPDSPKTHMNLWIHNRRRYWEFNYTIVTNHYFNLIEYKHFRGFYLPQCTYLM